MTGDQLQKQFPNASKSFLAINARDYPIDSKIPHPESKRHQKAALGTAVRGKEKGVGRTVVSFTGYRVRPLDPDGFAGSIKDLLDGCRRAGLIVDDSFWHVRLITDQVKVKSFKQEKTVIEIHT
jgi:hypothetical protein